MSAPVRVYVNGKGVDAPADATVLDAVRIADAAAADRIAAGERAVADSRGIAIANDSPLYNGAIFRVISNRQRVDGPAADAGDDA
jgi:hypothetical protein